MTDERADNRGIFGDRLTRLAVLLSALLSLASLSDVVFLGDEFRVLIALSLGTVLPIYLLGRRLYSRRTLTVTVSLGGAARVGKTVFVNVLCGRLMESRAKDLDFVPEAQTARHVYQIVSGLRHDRWPAPTSSDLIARYRGRLEFRRIPWFLALTSGRYEFACEIGDSAGETWQEASTVETLDSQSSIISSSFFEYIGESDAIVFFLDAGLFDDPEGTQAQVGELLAAFQLLRAVDGIRPREKSRRPICLVISKVDLLDDGSRDYIYDQMSHGSILGDLGPPGILSELVFQSLEHAQHLLDVLNQQASSVRPFAVSAIESLADQKIGPADEPDAVLSWVLAELMYGRGARIPRWVR